MKQDAMNGTKDNLHRLAASLVYQAVGMILTLLTAFLLALLISGGVIPPAARSATALCCVPGSFTAGLLTARRIGRHIIPTGLASGSLFFIFLLLISLLFLPGLGMGNGFFLILAACLAGGAIGALCTLGMHRR